MLKCVIVGDNICFKKELIKEGVEVIFVTGNSKDLFFQTLGIKPDLVILDIDLLDISGIKTAKLIRKELPDIEIIFLTSSKDYIQEAINVYAVDYILKPVNLSRLKKTLSRIKRKNSYETAIIHLNVEDGLELVSQNEICFVEALNKKTEVYTTKNIYITKHSLKEMETILNKNSFIRTSRSFLVNIKHVKRIKRYNRTSFIISFKDIEYKARLSVKRYDLFLEKIKCLQNP